MTDILAKFKQHIAECPHCSETDPTKLCSIGKALLLKIVEEHGAFDAIQNNKDKQDIYSYRSRIGP